MSWPAQSQEFYANVWKMDIVDPVVVALKSTISILPPTGPREFFPKQFLIPRTIFKKRYE
jgi:hypothetical protein